MEPSDQQIIDYLLGDIDEAEQLAVEETLFARDDFFERISAVENRLIDLYVLDKLSESERRAFEEKYLTSQRRQDAVASSTQFINLLEGYPRRQRPEPKKRWEWLRSFLNSYNATIQFSLASLVLVVSTACVWLFVERARLKSQNEATQIALRKKEEDLHRQVSNREQLATERSAMEREQQELGRKEELLAQREDELRALEARSGAQASGRPTFATFVLSNTVRSGADAGELVIQTSNQFVRLVAYLDPEDAERYDITIQSVSGRPVWKTTIPKPRSKPTRLTFEVPASTFQEKDYFVKIEGLLRGGQRVSSNEYPLSVRRQRKRD